MGGGGGHEVGLGRTAGLLSQVQSQQWCTEGCGKGLPTWLVVGEALALPAARGHHPGPHHSAQHAAIGRQLL